MECVQVVGKTLQFPVEVAMASYNIHRHLQEAGKTAHEQNYVLYE